MTVSRYLVKDKRKWRHSLQAPASRHQLTSCSWALVTHQSEWSLADRTFSFAGSFVDVEWPASLHLPMRRRLSSFVGVQKNTVKSLICVQV